MYGNHNTHIATVGELIAALDHYDEDTPVRWAHQPGHPMEYTIGQVVCTPHDAEGDGTPPSPSDPPVVWLGEGQQVGSLPALATNALRWSDRWS